MAMREEEISEVFKARDASEAVLVRVLEWWDGLPPRLRQDIEGSGFEPGCIAAARNHIKEHS